MEKSEQEHRTGHFECEAVRAFADMPQADRIKHLHYRHRDILGISSITRPIIRAGVYAAGFRIYTLRTRNAAVGRTTTAYGKGDTPE